MTLRSRAAAGLLALSALVTTSFALADEPSSDAVEPTLGGSEPATLQPSTPPAVPATPADDGLSNRTKGGLIAAAGGYALSSAMAAAFYRDSEGKVVPLSFVPIAGPFVALGKIDGRSTLTGRVVNSQPCVGDGALCNPGTFMLGLLVFPLEAIAYVAGPVAQVTGLVVAATGSDPAPKKTGSSKRFFHDVSVAPMVGTSHGLTLSFRAM